MSVLGFFNMFTSMNLYELIIPILIMIVTAIFSFFSFRTYKYVSDARTQGSSTPNVRPVLEGILQKLNSLEINIEQYSSATLDYQRVSRASLDNNLMRTSEKISQLEHQISDIGKVQASHVSEVEALPKPSQYIRFPSEFQYVYDEIGKKMKDVSARAQNINNNYDVKVYEPLLFFIIDEMEDIRIAQVPLENLTGRLAVIERLINLVTESFDNPEIIRRLKTLKEEGFSERLVLRY